MRPSGPQREVAERPFGQPREVDRPAARWVDAIRMNAGPASTPNPTVTPGGRIVSAGGSTG